MFYLSTLSTLLMYCTVHSYIFWCVHLSTLSTLLNVLYCTFYMHWCLRLSTLSTLFNILHCTSFDLAKKKWTFWLFIAILLHLSTLSTWMHVNGYNFLNNGLIFNCFIPLESSQSPLFSSACFSSILLIRSKESKETAWLYSTVYAFRSKESKDTKILPEMNRGDWDDSNGIKQLKIWPLWRKW